MPPIAPLIDPQNPTGAFQIDLLGRFDDPQAGYWQRLFDFGDGPGSNNILLSQYENTNDLAFEIHQDGQSYQVIAPDAIVAGETANFTVGIDADATMWIVKDGTLVAFGSGVVPNDTPRDLLIGESLWEEDSPLIGDVVALNVVQGPDLADDPQPVDPTPPVDEADPDTLADPIAPADPVDPVDPSTPDDGGGSGGPDTTPAPETPVTSEPPVVEEPPVAPPFTATGAGDMFIVAHQDDDLLFMNPTVLHQIEDGAPVTTVYLTAGDAARDTDYWTGREAGIKAAYATMSGSSDWIDDVVMLDIGGTETPIASSTLASDPDIRLYFLRLPDGFGDGSGAEPTGFQSLEQLWDGTIEQIDAIDGTASYTAQQLTDTLTALMDLHDPAALHIQDHTSEIEHSDHAHAAHFATLAAEAYDTSVEVSVYMGYESWGVEENLSHEDEADVRAVFLDYAAHDAAIPITAGMVPEAYEQWVMREYVVDNYVIEGDPAQPETAAPVLVRAEPLDDATDATVEAAADPEPSPEAQPAGQTAAPAPQVAEIGAALMATLAGGQPAAAADVELEAEEEAQTEAEAILALMGL